jgi:hypothetical protein
MYASMYYIIQFILFVIYMGPILNVHYVTGKQFRSSSTRNGLLLNQSTATCCTQRKIRFTLVITGTYI